MRRAPLLPLPLLALLFTGVAAVPSLHAQPSSALSSAARPAAAQPPAYPARAASVTVPFALPVDFNHLDATLKLLTSVNGGPAHAFTIDTGSVGTVLPAAEIPGFDPKASSNTPGELRYSSSGLTLDGFWTLATVRFLDPGTQQPLAVAAVQVLAVVKGSCQGGGANSGNCTGAIPHMLGVGFGRGGDASNGMRTQASNAFVNLLAMDRSRTGASVLVAPIPGSPAPRTLMLHGYLITRGGITFGLTAAETHGFQFVKLTPATLLLPFRSEARKSASVPAYPAPSAAFNRDYDTAPGSLTIAGHSYPMGAILMDTGLTNMIVEEPGAPRSGDLPAGQPVVVHLLGDQLRYRFTSGDQSSPAAPRRATWAAFTHGPFVNTGLRALACFDYLYDAENGYLGLRPTCKPE